MTRTGTHWVPADQTGKRVVTPCGAVNPQPHRMTTDYNRATCEPCRRKGKRK